MASTVLSKDPVTVSKWCTNKAQPNLDMLFKVAQALNVEVKDLIRNDVEILKKQLDEKTFIPTFIFS